jgi:hypothetical protein
MTNNTTTTTWAATHLLPGRPTAPADALLAEIAAEHLFIETLETRNSDSLDFHDVGVSGLRDALAAAFEAGRNA